MFSIRKKKIKDKGYNNNIQFIGCNDKNLLGNSCINIKGHNNHIIFDKIKRYKDSHIKIQGNNNHIKFSENCSGFLSLNIMADDCFVEIGKNSSFSGTEIHLWENKSNVIIGDDCIFASSTILYCTDFHAIIEFDGKPVNRGREIIIGNHCWIGTGVKVLKNVQLAENIIVGAGSVVSKSYRQNNVIIAGNPSRIVKENISWCPASYDEQMIIYYEKHKIKDEI